MEELLNIIANVGFPIAVAVFLLVRIEGKMTCLTKAINDLREAILLMPGQNAAHALSSARSAGREGA
ncbi:MAG: YvrJ family protein [Syntrophomonadaceae bacterium]|nr:YvrJ family protein [Syntrophomonadaceae bacterium]